MKSGMNPGNIYVIRKHGVIFAERMNLAINRFIAVQIEKRSGNIAGKPGEHVRTIPIERSSEAHNWQQAGN